VSSLYVKLFTNFYTHRKTLRLRAMIDDAAFWIPPRLWAYAAENQPDGIFKDYTAKEIAQLVGYTGDAPSMLQALLKAGFVDDDPLRIHDWQEYNGFHQTFAERAKKAASARWSKSPSTPSPDKENKKIRGGDETSIASSMLQASSPVILSQVENISAEKELTRINTELNKRGALTEYAKGSPTYLRIKQLTERQAVLRQQLGVVA